MKLLKTFILAFVATVVASCGSAEKYITYDPVQMHKEPSDGSPVVVNITCSPKPGYKEFDKKARLLYWTGPRNNPIPLTITKKEGDWGYTRIFSMEAREEFKGWLPLEKMLPCGGGLGDEVREVYTAKQNKVMLYRHPKALGAEQTKFWLSQGDTVQVLSKVNGWAHVHKVVTYTHVDMPELYGWAQLSQLNAVGTFSANSVAAENRAAETGVKAGLSLDTWRTILMIGCAICLLVFVIMAFPARKRSKFMSDILLKVLVGAALCAAGVWGTQHLSVDIMDALLVLVVPLLIYSALYPLLYSSMFSRWWKYLYVLLAVVCAVMVFLPAMRHWHGNGIHKAYFGLAVAALAFVLWRIWAIWKNLFKSVCPHCGYYASHEEGENVLDKEVRSKPRQKIEAVKIYTGDKVTMRGDVEVSREAQYRTEYRTVMVQDVTRYYHCDFTCARCGETWQKTWVEKEEVTL